MSTKDNLAELRRLGFDYLVNDKRARQGAWQGLFEEDGYAWRAWRLDGLKKKTTTLTITGTKGQGNV